MARECKNTLECCTGAVVNIERWGGGGVESGEKLQFCRSSLVHGRGLLEVLLESLIFKQW